MKAIWIWATRTGIAFSLVGISLAALAAISLQHRYSETQFWTFFIALGVVPLITLGSLRQAALRGLHHVILGQIPDLVLKPGFLLLFVLLLGFLVPLTPTYAMGAQLAATFLAFVAGAWFLWRKTPGPVRSVVPISAPSRIWWASAAVMALSAGMNQINNYADILILGLFRPAEDVGLYRVAYQMSMLTVFGLQAVAMTFAPRFAQLGGRRNIGELQILLAKSARISFIFGLVAAAVFVFLGRPILEIFFGGEFKNSYGVLVILVGGQVINAFFGAIGILLNMTGLEKTVARGMGLAAISNILLNFVLAPMYGMVGAAAATVFSVLIWNVFLWRSAWIHLGVDSRAIAFRRKGNA